MVVGSFFMYLLSSLILLLRIGLQLRHWNEFTKKAVYMLRYVNVMQIQWQIQGAIL